MGILYTVAENKGTLAINEVDPANSVLKRAHRANASNVCSYLWLEVTVEVLAVMAAMHGGTERFCHAPLCGDR